MPPKILVVSGPTASARPPWRWRLALAHNGEVVSADSMQIYRRMDIGTAKPTRAEMRGVPHHMLDVADPEEDFSVARYVELAARCVDDILARGKLPIVAGGTGLYIDSLLSGRTFARFDPDSPLRRELEEELARRGGGRPAGGAGPGGPGHRRPPPPQRRQAHRPGPGGVPLHRDHPHGAQRHDPLPPPPV